MHPTPPSGLPEPGPEERDRQRRLEALVRAEMAAGGGTLPFDRYMELALYAPGLGYYLGGARKFGAGGDFVTAPEISPLFGRCLANQCAQCLEAMGGGDLLEFGAGSGAMAAQLLAALEQAGRLPDRYLILELSAELRQRQRETLAARVPGLLPRVVWLEGLPPAGLRAVVVANELLDAMPVHRFRIRHGAVEEALVAAAGEAFELAWRPASPGLEAAVEALQQELGPLPEGYASEVNLRLGPWFEALGGRLAQGVVLLVDYGWSRRAYYHPERRSGTLSCHYRHRVHHDPLVLVGLQDITADVDFTAVALAGEAAGMRLAGYTTQAHFLIGNGLEGMVAASDPQAVRGHLALVEGVKRLTLPGEMGERFKAIALQRGVELSLDGFRVRDLRGQL